MPSIDSNIGNQTCSCPQENNSEVLTYFSAFHDEDFNLRWSSNDMAILDDYSVLEERTFKVTQHSDDP